MTPTGHPTALGAVSRPVYRTQEVSARVENSSVTIRTATAGDLEAVLKLAAACRVQYETYQPVFWRAAADAVVRQRP